MRRRRLPRPFHWLRESTRRRLLARRRARRCPDRQMSRLAQFRQCRRRHCRPLDPCRRFRPHRRSRWRPVSFHRRSRAHRYRGRRSRMRLPSRACPGRFPRCRCLRSPPRWRHRRPRRRHRRDPRPAWWRLPQSSALRLLPPSRQPGHRPCHPARCRHSRQSRQWHRRRSHRPTIVPNRRLQWCRTWRKHPLRRRWRRLPTAHRRRSRSRRVWRFRSAKYRQCLR